MHPEPQIPSLHALWVEWNRTRKVERFGQYVMNRTDFLPMPNPDIFHETDANVAFSKLLALWPQTE